MSDRFQHKYRIPSARAPFWNYGWNGAYFVTICTHKHECYFGNVINHKMELSEIGKTAKWCWSQIPNQFPYAGLDEYIVMPNHMHGIVIIDKPTGAEDVAHVGNTGNARNTEHCTNTGNTGNCRDAINRVSTISRNTQFSNNSPTTGGITGHHNPMLGENLGRIIR